MAPKIAEKAPGWVARVLLPEIADMKGELKNIKVRLDATNNRIDEMDRRLSEKIDSLDERLSGKIDELEKRLSQNDLRLSEKIDDLDKRLDMAQRLAVLEAKVKDQEIRKQ